MLKAKAAFIYFGIGCVMTIYGLFLSTTMMIFFGVTMGGLAGFRWWLYQRPLRIQNSC